MFNKSKLTIALLVIFMFSISFVFIYVRYPKTDDFDAYFAYCSTHFAAIDSRTSALYSGNKLQHEFDNACHYNALTETKDFIFFDTGLTIAKISKNDKETSFFEYQNRNSEVLEIGNATNTMYSKIYNEKKDLYMSVFPISGVDSVIKYVYKDEYFQYYIPLTDVKIFETNNKLNVFGFSDSYSKIMQYSLEFDENTGTLKNEDVISEYEMNEYSSIVPTSFFEYEEKLSTIYLDSDTCSLNLLQLEGSLVESKIDDVARCDDETFVGFGDFYEVSKLNEGKLYLSMEIYENGEGIKNIIFYIIDLKTLEFEKINMSNIEEDIGYNVNLATYIDEESIYVAAQKRFFTNLYEIQRDGSYKKVLSTISYQGNRILKSIVIDKS